MGHSTARKRTCQIEMLGQFAQAVIVTTLLDATVYSALDLAEL